MCIRDRLYSKWMHDICDAQRSDGNIPDVAPAFWNYYTDDVDSATVDMEHPIYKEGEKAR